MNHAHDFETARVVAPSRKVISSGALLMLLSAIAATQAANAGTPVHVERVTTDTVRAGEPRSGLFSDSRHLAIHVNREEVEGDDDSRSGSAADEDHRDDKESGRGDRQERDDGESTSASS